MNTGGGSVNNVGSESFRRNNTSRKCYICGQVGHIQRNCPQQRRGKPVEARGPSPVGTRGGQTWTTANHVVGEDAHDEYTET